uniref:pleckstrin homology domain-containing family O member 1 isoform X3 n=1 Tax=Ictidomys tridecemlineatus TaxID=43179 RepID=UPI001A9EDC8D|nr:pleckstrin homology domain-containing family O member 1 isoform X3 [Ictidomys tridecemlineatus]
MEKTRPGLLSFDSSSGSVKDEKNIQEVFDLSDYEKCEELRKSKSRSKKNHSKFTLAHSKQPGNTAPNLIFLAVSPEEKESWINALNSAITRAKNRVLDEVTVEEDSYLAHPTRDRAKIQHSRRPPTRGHLMAVILPLHLPRAKTSLLSVMSLSLGGNEMYHPGKLKIEKVNTIQDDVNLCVVGSCLDE